MRNLIDGLALLDARLEAALAEVMGAGVLDGMGARNEMTGVGFGH